jgi:xanthine dehydrogenase small subunit
LIRFILNNQDIVTDLPPGTLILDFVRYHQHLTGTKIGCNEGDCGACTMLCGEMENDHLRYRSLTSCLTPLGNILGKHVVTVEGVNGEGLNPVQQAMHDESATQCGFCTPGFVVSLAGYCLDAQTPDTKKAIASIDGNICRCTGYKSIERAATKVAELMQERKTTEPVAFAVEQQLVPAWFTGIKERLKTLSLELNGHLQPVNVTEWVSGGTDIYVQRHDGVQETAIRFLATDPALKGVYKKENKCYIGASTTVAELYESPVMQHYFPNLQQHVKLVSSTPIRNIATIGGNLINASPIGDFTIFFLALNATVVFTNGEQSRELPLRKLYKGYKTLDKQPGEYLEKIWFELPGADCRFHFEKVSKRTHLDIASVNSAIRIVTKNGVIEEAGISAGGVSPVPLFLEKTSAYLKGKPVTSAIIEEAIATAQQEISPISDARGTAEYKRLLLGQLIKAHFITLFPTGK